MKTIYLLISLSICYLHVFSQTDTDIIYKTTSNNTYYMYYYSDFISIGNSVYPLEGKENALNWQDCYSFNWREVKNLSKYIEPYIGPYLRDCSLTEDDFFKTRILLDLQGNLIYCEFDYPSKIDIPLTTIEQIETSLKANGKVKVTPIGTPRNDMYYIETGVFVNLKELQTQLYHPVAPSWNDDIAIQLNDVFPTATYYADNLLSRSYIWFYPSMFNYTDGSTATEGNIYISGIGEVAFTLFFINVTDRDIILDLDQITVRLDEPGYTYRPRISSMSIDGGPRLDIQPRTALVESDGGAVSITFYFDDILDMSGNYYNTYPTDYQLSLFYGNHNIFEHIIDERYDYDIFEETNITWYREGYIMFRYIYNENKVGRFYNKTTDTYFY